MFNYYANPKKGQLPGPF